MGQFRAYENTKAETRTRYPYLLDIQSDLLSELKTTIVIPLSPADTAAPMSLTRLNPSFMLGDEKFTAITQDMAGIARSQLGAQAYDLSASRSEIVSAVDFLISGI